MGKIKTYFISYSYVPGANQFGFGNTSFDVLGKLTWDGITEMKVEQNQRKVLVWD